MKAVANNLSILRFAKIFKCHTVMTKTNWSLARNSFVFFIQAKIDSDDFWKKGEEKRIEPWHFVYIITFLTTEKKNPDLKNSSIDFVKIAIKIFK